MDKAERNNIRMVLRVHKPHRRKVDPKRSSFSCHDVSLYPEKPSCGVVSFITSQSHPKVSEKR